MVCTGADMIAVTGRVPRDAADDDLVAQVDVGDDAREPVPPGPRTRIAERFSAIMIFAASWIVVSGSQNSGLLRMTDVTGSVRTSGSARMVPAAWSRRSRGLAAIHVHARPDG